MLSIAIAFPLVLSRIPEDLMFKVLLYGGGMADVPEALHAFEQGLHQAFLVSFGVTMIAALASGLRPSHSPREAAAAAAKRLGKLVTDGSPVGGTSGSVVRSSRRLRSG